MNAWLCLSVISVTFIGVVGWLLDRQADRGHELRWEERFYQPQLPIRRGPVRDAVSHPTSYNHP